MNIYIDESGDLGFSGNSSSYFIVGAIIAEGPEKVQQCKTCMKRVKKKFPKKYKNISELKYHNTDDTYRRRVLECISRTDVDIAYAVLRKEQVYINLRDKRQVLYNYITGSLVSTILSEYGCSHDVNVIIDKSLDGVVRDEFDKYLLYRSMEEHSNHTGEHDLEILHADSKKNHCIQAVDFIAGAVHRHYREPLPYNDYYSVFENRITIALDYFNGRRK
ncbi:DUF3800 domain-containing protein [Methanofollis aquaemaris]|uniref:DUF3800 domain-containing protein n=1 Tax=Methanofollis aquaemaris TaxID=126734 RepID=UPI00224039D8|nr:DUF3800 domain-containing protein [Methanofollis aquaemaris]